jgi:hypothetical protein
MAPRHRLAISIAGIALLVATSMHALRAGFAGSVIYDASVEINSWASSGRLPGPQTWHWTHSDLHQAVAYAPANPNGHDLLGVLDSTRTEPGYLAESIAEFTRAIELRPTSPYTWANIVEVKYLQGDTGTTFERAVVRAARLGPWEPEVQRVVADYGLAVWDEVDAQTREAVRTMVANGMRRNPKQMLQIAERRGRLAIACRQFPTEPRTLDLKWPQLCQGTEARQ